MTGHLAVLAALGFAILLMSWLPSMSKKLRVSYPVILLIIGFIIYFLGVPVNWPDPFWPDASTMFISEVIVVVSLMAAGLKIPIDKGFKFWKIPFRLIVLAMPLTMIAAYFLGVGLLGLSIPSALLLAAVLAPTDPVLAAEVQLAEPENQEGTPPETEFSLTAEAGMNDGFAFPFTFLAVLLIQAGSWEKFNLTGWILDEFLLKILLGILFGYLFSKFIIWLHQWLCRSFNIKTDDGLLAFAMAIAIYAATELLHGYGFLAVFVASITLKQSTSFHQNYKEKLHGFVDEIERLILVIWIILFGGSIMNGILSIASWNGVVFAMLMIFLVRPLSGMISLIGNKVALKEKLAISFFGIRGIGSLFYLSWAFVMIGDYEDKAMLYSIVAVVMLSSILIHGITAPFVFQKRQKERS